MAKRVCGSVAVLACIAVAAPGTGRAQGALDGVYAGVSAAMTGAMGRGRSCPQSFVPAPLTISGGRAQTRWNQQAMDGTVTPQGGVVMHGASSGRLEAQIMPNGEVRGAYNGYCSYTLTWQKRR